MTVHMEYTPQTERTFTLTVTGDDVHLLTVLAEVARDHSRNIIYPIEADSVRELAQNILQKAVNIR